MGASSSRQHLQEGVSQNKLQSLDALSIHRVEAEYVYRAMQRGWFGCGHRSNDVYDTPPASPLYDSGDDEPTEPSSVINALAVTVPVFGSQQHQSTHSSSSSSSSMRRTRSASACPTAVIPGILQVSAALHPHKVPARTASAAAAVVDAAAAAAAAPASTAGSSSSPGVLRSFSSGSSTSSSRYGRSSRSSRSTAEDALQPATVVPGGKAVRFAGAHRAVAGALVLPLSSAALSATNGKGAVTARQDMSLVTDRASKVDVNLRPLHHLQLMQQRRHMQHHAAHHKQRQQQQLHVAACAHPQLHSSDWYLAPVGRVAEIAASRRAQIAA